tara:strand:+ start:3189 stop:3824 length:636 start_codon:yes stop_codon:yes gene_type:complete
MLNKIKNKIKLYLKFYDIKQINFENYDEYKAYFIEEDKISNWDPSAFSKIIEENLDNKENLHLVEIGVARGATAKYTIDYLNKKILKYSGVDPYQPNYDRSDGFSYYNQKMMDNLYKFVNDKINDPRFNLIRKKSNKAYLDFEDNSIDAIYIDGDHTYRGVIKDIKYWAPKVKPGGLIVGDDYLTFSGVKKAVNQVFPNFNESGNTWFSIK